MRSPASGPALKGMGRTELLVSVLSDPAPPSPVGIWFEPGNFAEMVHTCNISANGGSLDGAYEWLEDCPSVRTRSYFNGGSVGGPFSLAPDSPVRADLGFRVVRDL